MRSLDATVPRQDRTEESVDHNDAGTSSSTLGSEISADLPSSNPIRRLISAESLHQHSPSTESVLPIRRTSYIPAIPSPLNPASPAASTICSVSSNDETAAGGNPSPIELSSSGDVPRQRQLERRSSSNLSPPQAILRHKSASILRPSTPETPKRLNNLGRDYSRYPSTSDVRSDSLRIAVTATPLLRTTTTTTNPFRDSQADLEKCGYPDDSIAAFHPYHGGEKGFILYADEIEADDNMHLPRDDDDVVYKAKLSDYFNRKQICSTVAVILLILGLACIFILLPVLTFTTNLLIPNGGLGYVHGSNLVYVMKV